MCDGTMILLISYAVVIRSNLRRYGTMDTQARQRCYLTYRTVPNPTYEFVRTVVQPRVTAQKWVRVSLSLCARYGRVPTNVRGAERRSSYIYRFNLFFVHGVRPDRPTHAPTHPMKDDSHSCRSSRCRTAPLSRSAISQAIDTGQWPY